MLTLVLVHAGLVLVILAVALRLSRQYQRARRGLVVGVFHPYAGAMGGGERVLWCSVAKLLRAFPHISILIYTGDVIDLDRVRSRFGEGSCPSAHDAGRIDYCQLRTRRLVEADLYPRFTLLGQSLGSVVLGLEALLFRPPPAIWFDSMGYAFTYPAAWLLAGCRVACYVHFPTISTDMLAQVTSRRPSYNNDTRVASSVTASRAKLAYYRAFAFSYSLVGRCAHVVLCNSTWTRAHIASLWHCPPTRLSIVYPPCLTALPSKMNLDSRLPLIVSIGQFRPEKDHRLQLASIRALRDLGCAQGKLVMIGSCRNQEDLARVEELRAFALGPLGLDPSTDFCFELDIAKPKLDEYLAQASLGIHTMWNEHFGIGVCEMMAAGLIVVAHDSGGPKTDIVTPGETGFLASTAQDYAACLNKVLTSPAADFAPMRRRASASTERFSEAKFGEALVRAMRALVLE